MRTFPLTAAHVSAALSRSPNCDTAAKALGVTSRGLRAACQRLGLPSPNTMLGALPAITTTSDNPGTTLVVPDMHVPYHDVTVWRTILQTVATLRPANVVIIGDFADCYSISFHPKTPTRRLDFESELAAVNTELGALCDLHVQRVIYCEGNHENRLQRYLTAQAPALYSMLPIERLLRVEERGWEWVPYQRWIKIGKIAYSHEVGAAGKMAAQQTLTAFGGNIVFGHSHRGGLAYSGTVEGDRHVALNVGWGGDVEAVDYMHRAKTREWQHGFGWVEQDGDGNGWCSFVPVIAGRCIVRGQVIQGA